MLKIPEIAACLKIFKHSKKQSAEVLMAQIGEFHLQASPFNAKYSPQINKPCSWWKMCEPSPPYLQLLAIKLFSIIPHAASCERVWSICGWMIGKRRTQLSVENLESMVKIHSYYIANSKSELLNYGEDRTTEEIYAILNNAQLCDDEEYDEEYEEMGVNDDLTELTSRSYTDDDYEQIPSQNLKILNTLDLNSNIFQNDHLRNETDDQDGFNNFIQELDKEDDFDPDQLAQDFVRNTQ
jgi:hypothetical protein